MGFYREQFKNDKATQHKESLELGNFRKYKNEQILKIDTCILEKKNKKASELVQFQCHSKDINIVIDSTSLELSPSPLFDNVFRIPLKDVQQK